MAKKPLPTPEELRQLLHYEPNTGKLFWLERPPHMFGNVKKSAQTAANRWNGRCAHKQAFTTNSNGYRVSPIFYRVCMAHRVAWALYHGEWPADEIDHINGDRSDNRISNLRAVCRGQNMKNTALRSNNTSGRIGVYWDKKASVWTAQIRKNGRTKHLGMFADFEHAIIARESAEAELDYHPNHGRAASQ